MINVEAILQKYTPAGDRSYKMYFQTTREASEELYTELGRKFLKTCRLVCVSDDDVENPEQIVRSEPPPAPKPENGEKSPSYRLRAAIYREWEGITGKSFNDVKGFEYFYEQKIECFINQVKEGLEPPLPEERG